MGGTTFETWQMGHPNVGVAFDRAYDQAVHEHGHGGYTGTLAEKGDYVVIDDEPRPLAEARRLAQRLIEAGDQRIDDKWGPAGAIAIADEKAVKSRTAEVTFKIGRAHV